MKNICVFCGSSNGDLPVYADQAYLFGTQLAQSHCRLIYGGGRLGLMGTLAQGVLDHQGEVYGVIPDFMIPKEVAHTGLTRLITTSSMHERKARMARLADGFAVLPGGMGTLDEMAEIITWNQLRIIDKPVGLLNLNGYFDPLLEMIKRMDQKGFLHGAGTEVITAFELGSDLLTGLLNAIDYRNGNREQIAKT